MAEKKYCIGCGVLLQDENVTLEGYTSNMEKGLCQRCFRLIHYGDYQESTKSTDEYIEILKLVGKTNDLVLYIVDLLNLDRDLSYIRTYIKNKMILVLNKRDVFPKSVKDEKLIEKIKSQNIDFEDIVIISCEKNEHMDLLMGKIKKLKTSNFVYVVGHTNAGKSTLINKFMKNYSTYQREELTISPLPSTTLNKIEIPIHKNLTLIDTPGLVDRGNITNYVASDILKKIHAKKEIKPKTYQMRKNQAILIENLVRIDYLSSSKNSFTLYVSNGLKVKRLLTGRPDTLKDLAKLSFDLDSNEDLVINGLGFIKVVDKCSVEIYIDKNVEVFQRSNLI